MSKQTINVGSTELAGDGESIRSAFVKANSNFTELYTQVPLATSATYAMSFNTSTLVAIAVTATYAQSYDPAPVFTYLAATTSSQYVGRSVTATNIVNGTWTLSLSTAGSILINNVAFVSGAGSATTSTLVNGANTVNLSTSGAVTLSIGVSIDEYNGSHFPRIVADTGKAFSVQGYGSTGSVALQWAETVSTSSQIAQVGLNKFSGVAAVTLTAGTSTNDMKLWTFSSTGTLTLPAGGIISDSATSIKLKPAGGANANQALLIYPTTAEGDHIHLTADGGSTELYLGSDSQYVRLVNNGNVEVRATTANSTATAAWTFGTNGTTLFPDQAIDGGTAPIELKSRSWSQLTYNNADMTPAPNKNHSTTFFVEGGDALLEIFRWDGDSVMQHRQWSFSNDGTLTLPDTGTITFPDATIQTTAYTGPTSTSTLVNGTSTVSLSSTGTVTITGTAIAISTQTGALQVTGGVGIGGGVFVGGAVTATTFVGVASSGTTSTTAAALGYIGMPQNSTASSYTLVAGDQGKHIYISATGQTITIPANTAVAFPIGTSIAFIAGPSATTVTIAITTDTMYLAGTGTTGSRTLAAYGMATAVKVTSTTWYINGTGLT